MAVEGSPKMTDLSTQMVSQIVDVVKTLTEMSQSADDVTKNVLSNNAIVFTPQCNKDAQEKEKISFRELVHPTEKASQKATDKVAPTKMSKT
jgi:hypothetical protein